MKKICLNIFAFLFLDVFFSKVLKEVISDNDMLNFLSFFISLFFILLYYCFKIVLNYKRKKESSIVLNISYKIKEINKLIDELDFKPLNQKVRTIFEKEYSRKSFDRVLGRDIVYYNLDNNIDGIADDFKNVCENKNKYDKLIGQIEKINVSTPAEEIRKSNFSMEKFLKVEKRLIDKIISDKSSFDIIIKIKVIYVNRNNEIIDSKSGKFYFEDVLEFYENWKNGKVYAANMKEERKVMNDNIRYNVFKRDNFTCKICGATQADGVKLHVDHIIPVSMGGKTVMSNLQTLCDRCNIGKGNKVDKDFVDDMICPKCGTKLVKRSGKYGDFIGCSNYPHCRYKRKL